ncbi:hypothetical protein F1C58_10790 [Glaciihabitans sp. INWT7]|uniref:hypothetical protein n=1 Tax=Glaciihabitans sp. INWT7 TaxID=2596912 RepID=UPI001624694C|nr:hypothetical protein [Glaciihabitans sp. INWT7]QNE47335.1 hypothetical protein F1C58_10790 [Glaciihabitans sp. INWT7]
MSTSKAQPVAVATRLLNALAAMLPGGFAALLLVSYAVSDGSHGSLTVLGIAAVTVASAAAIGYSLVLVGSSEMTVGARAQARRSVALGRPAPQHPTTPGRPRTRAPSQPIPAT